MSELRRQHQELLSAEGGPSESMSIMYGTLLRKYEAVKDDFSLLSKRWAWNFKLIHILVDWMIDVLDNLLDAFPIIFLFFDVSCHIIQIWWPGHLPLRCSCQVRAFSGKLQYSYCFSIKARASNLRYLWGIWWCFKCILYFFLFGDRIRTTNVFNQCD